MQHVEWEDGVYAYSYGVKQNGGNTLFSKCTLLSFKRINLEAPISLMTRLSLRVITKGMLTWGGWPTQTSSHTLWAAGLVTGKPVAFPLFLHQCCPHLNISFSSS